MKNPENALSKFIIGAKENPDGTLDTSKAASLKYYPVKEESCKEQAKETKDEYLSDEEIKERIKELEKIKADMGEMLTFGFAKRGLDHIEKNNLFQEIKKRYGTSGDVLSEKKVENDEVVELYDYDKEYDNEMDERDIVNSVLKELKNEYSEYSANKYNNYNQILREARDCEESIRDSVKLDCKTSDSGLIRQHVAMYKKNNLWTLEFIEFLNKAEEASKILRRLKQELVQQIEQKDEIEKRIELISNALC